VPEKLPVACPNASEKPQNRTEQNAATNRTFFENMYCPPHASQVCEISTTYAKF
jgi:hypothetical protein